jgi:Aerobic-type carbon monoxide dehydrogenase, large subunit CoxL/CutL homologs
LSFRAEYETSSDRYKRDLYHSTYVETQLKYIGKKFRRVEDRDIVRGRMGYADDIDFPGQHYAAILHSPYAHALIKSIDYTEALNLAGVKYVLTGEEVARLTKPITARAAPTSPKTQYVMAYRKVRYMGEPVVAVVAENKYVARDALDLINVEYERRPVVRDLDDALRPGAPLIYEELGTNVVIHDKFEFGDVEEAFQRADKTVKRRIGIHRYSSTPLETYVVNANYDKLRDLLEVVATDQQPGRTVQSVANLLGLPMSKIRLIVPPMGGGFGYKLAVWQYIAIISLLSMLTGRPVKWIQTRSESLYGPHRPKGYMDVELALSSSGKVTGMRLTDWEMDGNWPYVAGLYSLIKFANMSGPYEIPSYSFEYYSIATNYPPVVQDRGVGKPFMTFALERIMDVAAKSVGMDPAEFRLRNMVPPEKMPYVTPSGEIYESGNFPATLKKALEVAEYWKWKEAKKGRRIGVGISCGIEPGTSNLGYYYLTKPGTPDFTGAGEMSTVELTPDGYLRVNMNGPEIGTGHVTTLKQVSCEIFDLDPERVIVSKVFDSTEGHLGYSGTYSNAFNDVYIGAALAALRQLREKVLRLASHLLGTEPSDLEMRNGNVCEKGSSRCVELSEVARLAYNRLTFLPAGESPGLRIIASYSNTTAKPFNRSNFNVQLTHSNSAHVAVVEVDPQLGSVKILRYVIVHDAGRVINPGIVEGLAIGSTASGIGGALYEEFVFDEDMNNLSLTFGDYLKPTAMEIPDIEVVQMETPAPNTPFGTKAVGEGGAITSLAAVANAVEDALTDYGVEVTSLPLTPERIWKMTRGA